MKQNNENNVDIFSKQTLECIVIIADYGKEEKPNEEKDIRQRTSKSSITL